MAVWPLAYLASTTGAEERKFVVLLADIPKDRGGPATLPNRNDVWDQYFDKYKNGVGNAPLVMSFAEWWEECSYGDVTVSGDVYGWISLPWPTTPPDFDGDTGFQATGIISHVELQAGFFMEWGTGEGFNLFSAKYRMDFDGNGTTVGEGALIPFNTADMEWLGAFQADEYGYAVWTPGERFQDLNGDGHYDAGVSEWGIDKNGNGHIDIAKRATSYAQLLSASVTYPPEDAPEGTVAYLNNWNNDTEWFDSNGDGQWNLDGWEYNFQTFIITSAAGQTQTVRLFRGDWGATEMWVDRNGDSQLGNAVDVGAAVEGAEGVPSNLFWDFVYAINDPDPESNNADTEYLDEQMNTEFDFPEPFEDYVRRWNPGAHGFRRTSEEYARANFPGDGDALMARVGNHRYDPPDGWGNSGTATSSNKLQRVSATLVDGGERAEQMARATKITRPPEVGPNPWSLEVFWNERFGSDPPPWMTTIPYLRKFNPDEPVPPIVGGDPLLYYPFEPNGGGPFNNGNPYEGEEFTGTILPDYTDVNTGWYDGWAEFVDLESSIYHTGGDGYLGEITSASNNRLWGEDVGPGTSGGAAPDGAVEPGGPLAYNVHGDGGFDGGNQLNIEYMTWRTDGQSLTDTEIDFDGDGETDWVWYHRDVNLDGLIDLGEGPGVAGEYGLPNQSIQSNYGVDEWPGTPPNGGPSGAYPYNRHRMLEDVVAALDEAVDWDNFLGGPGPFGNVISGVVLCPDETAQGMFSLPASSFDQPIRTRDVLNPTEEGLEHYVPVMFFDGLGIALSAGQGEGGTYDPGETFHTTFSVHEYCHMWEGYPDLYDYDVYRENFSGAIINNPIGAWCIMAGNYVHPVPILKQDSGWITPVDITRNLDPRAQTTIELRTWEFDRNRTVFVYTNPLYPSEQFYLWRNSPGTVQFGQLEMPPAFDVNHPGWGVLIMHVDRQGNLEDLPIQQRVESHFIYQMVQADGLQQLEAGTNSGDDGDPWPGSSGATQWDRSTDPSNVWYDAQSCGLEIVDIQELVNSSLVTFYWSPRELPTFTWRALPDVSVNGIYSLRYRAYDQYGGTTIQFYADLSEPGEEPDYDYQIFLGNTTKAPGEVDGVFPADIRDLADGVYTFYARLLPGLGVEGNYENGWSAPRAALDNLGDGTLTVDSTDLAIARFETWTVTCVNDSATNFEQWEVVGSESGTQEGLATTSAMYASDADEFGRIALNFILNPGPIPFRVGDTFRFLTTGLTKHSQAVLIDEGEVVVPQAPTAVARVSAGSTVGLAPLTLTFNHDGSSDPHGASLEFTWNFGDGSEEFVTRDINRPVTYTYDTPGRYDATLTVKNAFNLQDQDAIEVVVTEALPPTVRITAAPLTGVTPLRVQFSGDLTTDPNSDTQGLDYAWDFGDGSPPVLTSRTVHTYTDPGIYLASLTVTNRPYGKSATRTVEIRATGTTGGDQPPMAIIVVNKLFGPPPLNVTFDATTSFDPEGGALDYVWDFDDNSALAYDLPVVEHEYTRSGTYYATLTVTDEAGQSDQATIALVVTGNGGPESPVAQIMASGTQGPAPFTVTFDGTASSDPNGSALSYAWDFGDGSPQVAGDVVDHTYTEPRQYNVVLAVANTTGAVGSTTIKITVTSPADGQSGQPAPGTGDVVTEIPPGCGPGCGPVGMMPMVLTLIGLGGLRRYGYRKHR
ncbi:MAG: PKD domain-containing protein [Planctomycetota bacterium]